MENINDFFKQRVRIMLQDEDIRYDVIDATIENENSIYEIFRKAYKTNSWFNDGDRSKFVDSFVRINNLTSKEKEFKKFKSELLKEKAEKDLYEKYLSLKDKLDSLYNESKIYEYLDFYSQISETIYSFFEKVMVMDKDENIRANRMALINMVEEPVKKILAIEKIVLD